MRKEGLSVRKANDVIGLPVLSARSGEDCGIVRDVMFDDDWSFQGMLVEVKALFRKKRFVPSSAIQAIGEDYVMIDNDQALRPIEETDRLNGIKSGTIAMSGKPVISSNGNFLGQIEDVFFETEFGEIVGYELSDGMISDIIEGRKAIKHEKDAKIAENAVILPSETPSMLTEREEIK